MWEVGGVDEMTSELILVNESARSSSEHEWVLVPILWSCHFHIWQGWSSKDSPGDELGGAG